jgi:Na+-transporting NADH:ubiquinone oxidoreductase subunit A
MAEYRLKRGLDIPISGTPAQEVHETAALASVALIGDDYLGLKPRMLVAEGDTVRRGAPLFSDKASPSVLYTAPCTGVVRAINRGPRRVLESVVIEVTDHGDPGVDFGSVAASDIAGLAREKLQSRLAASGLWTAFRTRPYSKVPVEGSDPAAIFVTAMDTEPLAPDPGPIISDAAADFAAGLAAVARLTHGTTHLCRRTDITLPGEDTPGVETHGFSGPHPAGLAGTHMHFIDPPGAGRIAWSIGYQDVIAIGRLLLTGHVDPARIIAISGPRAANPRLVRTVTGAALDGLIEGEITSGKPARVISGSVLTGRAGEGSVAWLGRYARQVTLITEDREQQMLGWLAPQPGRFSVMPVLISAFRRTGLFTFTTNLNGGRRAMVPTGVYEELMPQDYLPTQLLRSLLVMDTDSAQALGALELDEEDLALCTFACPAKYEYGDALRASLEKIEKEG